MSVAADFSDANKAGLQPVSYAGALRDDEVPLQLQQTHSFVLKAVQKVAFKEKDEQGRVRQPSEDVVKRSTVTVPRAASEAPLILPIPKPALFGKQTFALTLTESGRITSLGYGRTAGAPGARNAVGSLAGEQTAEDTAEAAALKAAADLIAQQARLNTCVLKPTECK